MNTRKILISSLESGQVGFSSIGFFLLGLIASNIVGTTTKYLLLGVSYSWGA